MTAPIPPILPRWANEAAADVTEPGEAQKDTGWVGGATPDRPAAQHMNWLLRQSYEAHLWWMNLLVFRPESAWVSSSVPFSGQDSNTAGVNQLAYSPTLDIYVAVGFGDVGGFDQAMIASSPDASTWITRVTVTSLVTASLCITGVKWISSLAIFVAFGGNATDGPYLYTSTDGIAWASEVTTGFTDVEDVDYDPINTTWIAISPTLIRSCPDITAAVWVTEVTLTGFDRAKKIAVDPVNGITSVLITNSSTTVSYTYRATDAITYFSVSLPGTDSARDLIWDGTNERFVVSRNAIGTPFYPSLSYSTDGSTWSQVTSAELGIEETATFTVTVNPDYGYYVLQSLTIIYCVYINGSGLPAFGKVSPVGSVWISASSPVSARPLWDIQPAGRINRSWLLCGSLVGASNDCIARSTTPSY